MQAMLDELDPIEWLNGFKLIQNRLFVPDSEAIDHAFTLEAQVLEELDLKVHRPLTGRVNGGVYNMQNDSTKNWNVPIIIDSGCSISLTPFMEDFVTPLEPASVEEMEGIGNKVKVHGKGWVEWRIRDVYGRIIVIKTQAYYVPCAKIRLFSPQTYFQENKGGSCLLEWDKVTLTAPDGTEGEFPYNHGSNLPLMFQDWIESGGLSSHCIFNLETGDAIEHTARLMDENNINLQANQKELSLWHYRLCHVGFSLIQSLMRPIKRDFGRIHNHL